MSETAYRVVKLDYSDPFTTADPNAPPGRPTPAVLTVGTDLVSSDLPGYGEFGISFFFPTTDSYWFKWMGCAAGTDPLPDTTFSANRRFVRVSYDLADVLSRTWPGGPLKDQITLAALHVEEEIFP